MSGMPKANSKSGESKSIKKFSGSPIEKLTPLLIVVSIVLAFAVGVLWQKVQNLSPGATSTKGNAVGTTAPADNTRPQNGKLSEVQAKAIPALSDKDHVRGSKEADILLIEYSDLECPFCKTFHPTTQKLTDEYKDKLALVYRHFPLDQIHPKADKEAEAAECVRELGGETAFWKFVDKIFEVTPSNNGLDHTLLPTYAGSAGVSETAFSSCLDSGKYKDYVEADFQGGVGAGVTGTPASFIVNKKGEAWMVVGAQPYESVKAVIEEALKS